MDFAADVASAISPAADLMTARFGLRYCRTLAIVGSHPVGLNLVPWEDEETEIWIFNEAPLKPEKYPRWDAVLQIHGEEVYASPNNWVNSGYWDWLQQAHGKPIFMQKVDPRVPDSVEYPLDEILKLIPWPYLRSSPAMALALGIYLGYPRILLFGSELSSNTEYAYQATNYAFWIGFALGRGIDLQLNCWQGEFNQAIYGYQGELQISRDFYESRYQMHAEAWKTNEGVLKKVKSRLSDAMMAGKFQEVGKLTVDADTAAMAAGEAGGAMREAKRYLEREDHISRQEFERCAAKGQQAGDEIQQRKFHLAGKCEVFWNAWVQTGKLEALSMLRQSTKELLEASYQSGEKLGEFRENLQYMNEYDRRLQAAGGTRALGRQGGSNG